MSDLQRAFAKGKLASYPATMPPSAFPPSLAEEEIDHVDTEIPQDDDSSSASSVSSAGTIIPSQDQKLFVRPTGYAQVRTFF